MSEAAKEAVWLRGLMNELGFDQGAVSVYCDSHGAIALAKNVVFHGRTKHVQVNYHFLTDLITEGWVNVVKIELLIIQQIYSLRSYQLASLRKP